MGEECGEELKGGEHRRSSTCPLDRCDGGEEHLLRQMRDSGENTCPNSSDEEDSHDGEDSVFNKRIKRDLSGEIEMKSVQIKFLKNMLKDDNINNIN